MTLLRTSGSWPWLSSWLLALTVLGCQPSTVAPGTDAGRADAPPASTCVVAGRTGVTDCPASPSGSCPAGQYCDAVMLTCSVGCTGDANCPGDEQCVRGAGEAVGVCSPCVRCGDGRCDDGEACAADCPVAPRCGDGACNGSETTASCPGDCGAAPRCGDGLCNESESELSCADDCASPVRCGDGICGASETALGCPEDCDDGRDACYGICNDFELFECIDAAAPCIGACDDATPAQRRDFEDCVNVVLCTTHDACIGLLSS